MSLTKSGNTCDDQGNSLPYNKSIYSQRKAEEYISQDTTSDQIDTVDAETKLDILEMRLCYTSMREVLNDEFEVENVEGWANVDDIPEGDFPPGSTTILLIPGIITLKRFRQEFEYPKRRCGMLVLVG